MLPSYENLVEAAYKIEAIDAGISEAVHSTQWALYTFGNTHPLMTSLVILSAKEELIGGTVDWSFILCTLDVM